VWILKRNLSGLIDPCYRILIIKLNRKINYLADSPQFNAGKHFVPNNGKMNNIYGYFIL